ncbi:hypothetical protein [Pseudaminobacter salicylatoxidans]|uniref:hypothetical protein n=1 Tax=Pseudaminobacter salicylatoxidans TaxID=93369 RepID=UPI00031655DD|nr:hypothetical protein [Pseudaminobacter salicylatoxidans]
MTEAEIAEMFIRAAETEAKLPEVKGMRESYGRYALPWVHDLADINGRGRTGHRKESLEKGDDPLEEWRTAWLDEWAKRASKEQIAHWEACLRITTEFLTDPGQRRALWAWAMAQAGCLYRPGTRKKISFAKWCREVERCAEITGIRRKTRALAVILQGYTGKVRLHDDLCENGVLPNQPENGHVFATIEGDRATYDAQPVYTWRDDPSFERKIGMTIEEWRAAKRRMRQGKRKVA